jgi:hypothetical protein
MTEKHLTLLSQQLVTTHPDDFIVVSYEELSSHDSDLRAKQVKKISDYLDLDYQTLFNKILPKSSHYANATEDVHLFLDHYFDERRTFQWNYVEKKSLEPSP